MLQEAHALRAPRPRRRRRLRRDLRPSRHAGAAQGSRGHSPAARWSIAARRWRRWTWTRSSSGKPQVVRGRRAGAHQRARQPERQAVPGRARDSRRRHPRDDGGEHPAPRDAQRRGRQGHRRARARNGARYVSRPRRRGDQRRRDGRGAAQPAARGKDLPAGEGRAGAHQLLPQGQPVDAARAGAARGRRRSRREGRDAIARARGWSRR